MDYIIIGLLCVVLVLLIVLLTRPKRDYETTEKISRMETEIVKEIGDFKNDFSRDIRDDFEKTNEKIDERLRLITEKVNERLDENFEKTNKTFASVLERLSKIDEAQKKIDTLSNDIISLQGILTDKKTRGIFGEVNLEHIMTIFLARIIRRFMKCNIPLKMEPLLTAFYLHQNRLEL